MSKKESVKLALSPPWSQLYTSIICIDNHDTMWCVHQDYNCQGRRERLNHIHHLFILRETGLLEHHEAARAPALANQPV